MVGRRRKADRQLRSSLLQKKRKMAGGTSEDRPKRRKGREKKDLYLGVHFAVKKRKNGKVTLQGEGTWGGGNRRKETPLYTEGAKDGAVAFC